MALKKQIEWDGQQLCGYIDSGSDAAVSNDDSRSPATDACVIMCVAMNASWKLQLGYFFIAGMSGLEQANLLRIAIGKLHDVGIIAKAISADGPSAHLSMFKELGAELCFLCKQETAKITSNFVRKALTRLVIFSHQ